MPPITMQTCTLGDKAWKLKCDLSETKTWQLSPHQPSSTLQVGSLLAQGEVP